MAATVDTARGSARERSWWLRAPAVLVAPRAVFVSLRDESDAAIEARQEQLVAIAGLAGIAAVLATPVARQLLNDASFSVSLVPVWAFFGGVLYAVVVYWLGGGLLYRAAPPFGGLGRYPRGPGGAPPPGGPPPPPPPSPLPGPGPLLRPRPLPPWRHDVGPR